MYADLSRARTGRPAASTTMSTVASGRSGSSLRICEKYRHPMGPGAHRNSSVPTGVPAPSVTR